jgi:hypothetical protein
MIKTADLIVAMVADARPVRRLRPPVLRAALWLLLSALIFGLLAMGHGVRPDLAQQLKQVDFVVGTAASLLTGALAAVASFMLNLPDRSRGWALLPVPALLVWMSTLGYGCLVNWVNVGPDGIQLGEAARCFATVLLTSLPLSLAMFAMLRHGALLSTSTLSLTGSLAVAAISATVMSIFHRLDATVMILIWNLGSAVLIVALGRFFAPRLVVAGR